MKPAKTDKKAPKLLRLKIDGIKNGKPPKSVEVWGVSFGSLRQFKDGQGGMGYNFSARMQNPENGEAYIFSGNLVLIGSAPKKKGGKK
jgi:hypothetical protein